MWRNVYSPGVLARNDCFIIRFINKTKKFSLFSDTVFDDDETSESTVAMYSASTRRTVSSILSGNDDSVVQDKKYRYIVGKFLGGGAFGRVYQAKDKTTNEGVVLKFIKKETNEFPEEVLVMEKLSHVNIVQFISAEFLEGFVQIAMKCHGETSMSLASWRNELPNLCETLLTYIGKQILAGLTYMHGKCIAHMDIKPDNIVINKFLQVKIIDFGLAIPAGDYDFDEPYYDGNGTIVFMSPEMHFYRGYYGRECDIWAFGCTLYKLFTGVMPFNFTSRKVIILPRKTLYKPIQRKCSKEIRNLFAKMFDRNLRTRISAEKAKKHAWFNRKIDVTTFPNHCFQPFFK